MKFFSAIIFLEMLGLILAPITWAQLVSPPDFSTNLTPILKDRNGTAVGRLVASGPGSYGAVILNINRESLVLNLSYDIDSSGVLVSNGLSWQQSGILFYTSANCSGQPYVGFGNLGSQRPAAVLRQENKWFAYVGRADDPDRIGTYSYLPPEGTCIDMFSERKVVPVVHMLDLNTIGLPPFYIH